MSDGDNIIFYEGKDYAGRSYRAAQMVKDGVHLRVVPHVVGDGFYGYEVQLFRDNGKGEPDTLHGIIDICPVDGKPDDLEEIADTYGRRLFSGVKPEEMFRDIEEANLEAMRRMSEQMRNS
ncbi:hypothetical protein HY410_00675 [Candidatus Gottesmanbacteria bacterium]|nr:hypothetical protein [Candidatus Gottesmanbacteria bacterium]